MLEATVDDNTDHESSGDAVQQSDESQGGAVLSPPHRCEDGLIILTAAFVCSHAAVLHPGPSPPIHVVDNANDLRFL